MRRILGFNSRLERRTFTLVGAAGLALLVATVFVLSSSFAQSAADDRAQQVRQVQVDNQRLVIGMGTQRAAIGAFLQSGHTDYLGLYTRGRLQVLDAAARLAADSAEPQLSMGVHKAEVAASAWEAWAEAQKVQTEIANQPVILPKQVAEGDQLFDLFAAADDAVTARAETLVTASLQDSHSRRIFEVEVLIGLAAASLLGLGVIVQAFRKQILRPITTLADAARTLAQGGSAEVPPNTADDEIGELSRALVAWRDAAAERLNLIEANLAGEERFRAELEHQALHDPLTGLPNRQLLQDRLGRGVAEAGRQGGSLALMIVDLDHFKEVNDSLGHPQGDQLLVQVAQRLREGLREVDTVARLGGDEFALVLPRVGDRKAAAIVARKVLEALERPFELESRRLAIAASLGVAIHPQDGDDPALLMSRADAAMYAAKRRRTGFAVYSRHHDVNSSERLALITDLRGAIGSDQLTLHYQPQLECATGQIVGFEGLARWRHPQRGMIPPDKFIPLAEQTGLIRQLGLWALETAIRQAADWGAEGLNLSVSVNVSVSNLQDPDFLHAVQLLLQRTGPAEGIKLEITESIMMLDPERVLKVLLQLRAWGFRLALDDFGVGHSSLSYLRRLPVDELKIDRSFVSGLGAGGEDSLIVKTATELGHAFGLRVVAEGVETRAQLEAVQRFGCDRAQGYLIGRPGPADRVQLSYAGEVAETHSR